MTYETPTIEYTASSLHHHLAYNHFPSAEWATGLAEAALAAYESEDYERLITHTDGRETSARKIVSAFHLDCFVEWN